MITIIYNVPISNYKQLTNLILYLEFCLKSLSVKMYVNNININYYLIKPLNYTLK